MSAFGVTGKDWLVGLLVSAVVAWLAWQGALQGVDRLIYESAAQAPRGHSDARAVMPPGGSAARPQWASAAGWAALALASSLVILMLPRLGGPAVLLFGLLGSGLILGVEYGLARGARVGVPLGAAAALLLAGTVALLAARGVSAGPERAGVGGNGGRRAPEDDPEARAGSGESFGPYRLEQSLGPCGAGSRYVGTESQSGRRMLLCGFELDLGGRELTKVSERFLADLEQARQLEHPNLLPVVDGGVSGPWLYLASDYVEAWDLRRVARPDRLLKIPQAMEIVAKCAEALAYAHARQLVHGAVCPSNILYLTDDRQIRLAGLGTAAPTRALHDRDDRLRPTSFCLSPEHLTGDRVDAPADLFALGVTLYQLLSGQPPFRADTLAALSYRIVNEPQPSIQALRPEVPECAVQILHQCLAKDPAERYPDGLILARELRGCARQVLRSAS